MEKAELLNYLYSKLKANPDGQNQVCFVKSDYETIKSGVVTDIDIIKINKILLQLASDGYIQCSRLSDLHIYAGWITIVEKAVDCFDEKRGVCNE